MAADYYLPTSKLLLDILHIPVMTPAGLALDKLDSSIIIIGSILILTGLSGAKPADLFLADSCQILSLLLRSSCIIQG